MKTPALSIRILFLLLAALLAGCGALEVELVQRTTPAGITPSPDTIPPAGADTEWTTYTNNDPYLSFHYPAAWQAPMVTAQAEEGEDRSISVTLCSDPPEDPAADWLSYPEGAYGIVITYMENASQEQLPGTPENNELIQANMGLTLIGDGESALVRKTYYTRLGPVTVGGFHGVDFIGTLPEKAQASFWWTHNTVLVDSRTRILLLTGTPLNPRGDMAADNWRDVYRAEDDRYQEIYQHILATLLVEP